MRPLHVVHVDHTGRPGGGQLGLARYLRQPSDLRRSAVFLADGPVAEAAQRSAAGTEGVEVVRLSGGAPQQLRSLRETLDRLGPDLVVANSMRAAVAIRACGHRGAPAVTYVRQHLSAEALGHPKALLYRWAVLARSDGFLVNSRWTAAQLPAGVAGRPVQVAYPVSGVDRAAVRSRALAPAEHRPIRLAAVGRFQEWKGQHVAIEAVRLLGGRGGAGLELSLLGGPHGGSEDYLDRCRRSAAGSAVPVHFLGHVAEVGRALADVDVLLHTPLVPEPFGQVVVQALAAGCEVLSTSGGGAAEILAIAGRGVTVPRADPAEVAAAVLELVLRLRSGTAGRPQGTAIEPFLDEATAAGLDEAQRRLLAAIDGPQRAHRRAA